MINPKFNIGDIFYYIYAVNTDYINGITISTEIYKISEIIYDGESNIFYTLASKPQNKEKIETCRISEEALNNNNNNNIYKSRDLALETAVKALTTTFNAAEELNIKIKEND